MRRYVGAKQKLPKGCVKVEKYANRPSPPYHANECKNMILEGSDGDSEYISSPNKNGVYSWKKLKGLDANSAEQYYGQFPETKNLKPKYNFKPVLKKLNTAARQLEKHNIHLVRIGWRNVGDWVDWAETDALYTIAKKCGLKDDRDVYGKISYIFYTDNRRFWSIVKDGKLYLSHNILKHDKPIVDKVFKKIFGTSYLWKLSNAKNIIINLPKL